MLLLAASSSAVVMPIVQERGLTGETMLLATAWIAIVDIASIIALPLALTPSKAVRIAGGGVLVTVAAIVIFGIIHAIRDEPVVSTLREDSRKRGMGARPALFACGALRPRGAGDEVRNEHPDRGVRRRDDRGARG